MSQPITLDILSDDDDDDEHPNADVSTTLGTSITQYKNQRTESNSNPTVFVIDDDPTPRKSESRTSIPSFGADTEMSKSYLPIVKCTKADVGYSSMPDPMSFGMTGLICLESDNESETSSESVTRKQNPTRLFATEVVKHLESSSTCIDSTHVGGSSNSRQTCGDSSSDSLPPEYDITQLVTTEEVDGLRLTSSISRPEARDKDVKDKKRSIEERRSRKRMAKEIKAHLMEEKKQQKEQMKLQKEALKAEAAKIKTQQKELRKWETGKSALNCIVAKVDTKVVELGSVGGHLLTRLAEKGLTYEIASNPVERSIVWTMSVPENISQAWPKGIQIPYVLLVYEANEFCNLVTNGSLIDHVSCVQDLYPSHTVCYATTRLMAYINKREQGQYRNPTNNTGWKRPPVEELLSKLTTLFTGVHSRLCIDEAELADHVVGLTCSLASCQFRKKLTRLSVNANGSLVTKDSADRALLRKNLWLKALVAIPKVQPRFAVAIWKRYPTMKSLLSAYMDPSNSVHAKEFLLKDLTIEGLLGEDRRLGEICSKRVYRILMAQHGSIKTDDVENGADFFTCQSS